MFRPLRFYLSCFFFLLSNTTTIKMVILLTAYPALFTAEKRGVFTVNDSTFVIFTDKPWVRIENHTTEFFVRYYAKIIKSNNTQLRWNFFLCVLSKFSHQKTGTSPHTLVGIGWRGETVRNMGNV